MNRQEYIEEFYSVWGAEEDPQDRINLLNKVLGECSTSHQEDLDKKSAESNLAVLELFFFGEEDEPVHIRPFPDKREIRIQKACWDRGIKGDSSSQLRYFEYHHYPVFESVFDVKDPEEKLRQLQKIVFNI